MLETQQINQKLHLFNENDSIKLLNSFACFIHFVDIAFL